MTLKHQHEDVWISEEEYLRRELLSDIKHEYIDGRVYAMADVSRNHARISGNLRWKLGTHLKHTPCEVFSYGLKLKTGKAFFYPDVMVGCR